MANQPDGRVQAPLTTDTDPLQDQRRNLLVPVDMRNTAPQGPPPAQYFQLANALKDINPEINGFLGQYMDHFKADQVEQAKDLHIKSNLAYQEAINRGVISPDQSPYFMRAWKELDGQNQADTIAQGIQQDYATDPIRNSTDPTAIAQWFSQKSSAATANLTDPDVLAGAAPKIAALQQSIFTQQSNQASTNAVYGMTSAAGTQVGNLIDQYKADIQNNGITFNASDLAGRIQGPMGLAKFAGLDPKQADQVMMEAVIAKAKQYNDKDLLQVASQSRPDMRNPGQTLPGPGSTAAGQGMLFAAGKEIDNAVFEKQNRAYEQEQHARTLAVQNLGGQVMDDLFNNKAPDPVKLNSLIKLDGSKANEIQQFQLNQIKLGEHMDPARLATTLDSLLSPDASGKSSQQRLTDIMTSSNPLKVEPQQLAGLYKEAKSTDDSGVTAWKPLSEILSSIDKDGTDPASKALPMFADTDAKTAVKAAIVIQARNLAIAQPGVDPTTLIPQLTKIRDDAINNYKTMYPSKINLGTESKSHAEVTSQGDFVKPEVATTNNNGDIPGQFAAPDQEALKDFKKNATNQDYVNWFKRQYGYSAYIKAMQGFK